MTEHIHEGKIDVPRGPGEPAVDRPVGTDHGVIANIRRANVEDHTGWIVCELTGTREALDSASNGSRLRDQVTGWEPRRKAERPSARLAPSPRLAPLFSGLAARKADQPKAVFDIGAGGPFVQPQLTGLCSRKKDILRAGERLVLRRPPRQPATPHLRVVRWISGAARARPLT